MSLTSSLHTDCDEISFWASTSTSPYSIPEVQILHGIAYLTQCFPKCVPWTTCFGITWMRGWEEEERKGYVTDRFLSWVTPNLLNQTGRRLWRATLKIFDPVDSDIQDSLRTSTFAEQDCLSGVSNSFFQDPFKRVRDHHPQHMSCPEPGSLPTQIMETLQPILSHLKAGGCVLIT